MLKPGPLTGQTLGGKYLLGELLGKGGFGAVYKAENQMLHRQQAVKVLLEEHFSDEKFRDRFLREARTLGALDHASIVHVDDIGMEGNLIYLVMPYISGGTLQDILKARSGPLGVDEVMRYLEQICSALGYAHAQGVVHLDLKPLNLLVHRDGRLLLSDFGLAHLMEQGAIEGGTSLQFGSPLYMAPEHFDGKPSQRSDLYALGVMMYQMLAGRHPFEASTPAAVMRKHLTEPPPSLHAVRPDLPVALDAVIAKALAKEPEQRYGRAGELLFDFRAALGGQTLQFSSAAESTQRAQVYLDQTMRAANPPIAPAGPTLFGGGPATPPPVGQPFVPQAPPGFFGPATPVPPPFLGPSPLALGKLKIWTPGFTGLFVMMAIAGGVVTLIVNILLGNLDDPSSNPFVAIDWMALAVLGVAAVICPVGLRFVRSNLLRVGLLLQAGSLISNIIDFALIQHLNTGGSFDLSYGRWVDVYVPLLLTVLNAASLIVISYGIAPWQRAQDAGLIVVQIILSGAVAFLLLHTLPDFSSPDASFWLQEGGSGFLLWMMMAATLFAASVFLLRPACWRQHPVLTWLLALGALLFVLQTPGAFLVLEQWAIGQHLPFLTYLRVLYSVWLLPWLLFMLSFVLLIQTERLRKKVQQVTPIPALVGQYPT